MRTAPETIDKLTELLEKVKLIESEIQSIIDGERGQQQVEGARSQETSFEKEKSRYFRENLLW